MPGPGRPPSLDKSPNRQRAERLLGEAEIAEKFTALCGTGRDAFFRWERSGIWPAYAVTILDLMDEIERLKTRLARAKARA